MTAPDKIETYTAIATLWADYFDVHGAHREKLIGTYVRRCQERRFWCTAVKGRIPGEALCRLGHKMIYFDGRLLHVVDIRQWPESEIVFGLQLKPNPPTPKHARELAAAARKHITQAPLPPIATFDALTTFSRGYKDMISTELGMDLGGVVDLHPDIETRSMRFIRPRRRFYNGTGAGSLKELASFLAPEILRTIRGVQCPSMSLYNWIAAGDATRRIQAVRAYPLLLPLLILSAEKRYLDGLEEQVPKDADPDKHDYFKLCARANPEPRITSRAAEAIGKQVDAGERLLPIIASAFEVPETVIKQLAKHPVHHTGSALRHVGRDGWTRSIDTYTYAAMLGNRKPATKKAWTNWLLFYRAFPSALSQSIPQKDWPAFLAGMPDFGDPRWGELTRKSQDLRDLGLQRWKDSEIKGWPLARMLNLSEKWHEERARFVQQMNQEDERNAASDDYGWPPLLAAPFSSNTLAIVELSTPDQLSDEARRLAHCVDGYSTYCYDGRSRILSIRDGNTSIATMQMCLKPFKKKPGASHLYCAQLRGYRNDGFEPNSPVMAIAKKLMSEIRAGKIETCLEWPNVPIMQRPLRMRRRDARVIEHMTAWIQAELGIAEQRQMAPAA